MVSKHEVVDSNLTQANFLNTSKKPELRMDTIYIYIYTHHIYIYINKYIYLYTIYLYINIYIYISYIYIHIFTTEGFFLEVAIESWPE